MSIPVLRGVRIVALGLALATMGSGVAVAQEAASPAVTAPELERITGDTYVGATSNPDLFIAVVIGEDSEARAYLCDDTGVSEWLTGTLDGAALELTSASGATLQGTVGGFGAIGTATLPDGMSVTFDAVAAEGVGGLFTSVISDDRRVRGTSSTGASLDGLIAERPIAMDGEPVYPLLGFLTPAEGVPVGFAVTLVGPDIPDETRSITLNDGQQRGRSRKPGRVWVTDPMAVPIQDGTSNT